jgi:hypothetical protein
MFAMALPGKPGAPTKETAAEVEKQHRRVVHLRLTHPKLTWAQIGKLTGYSAKVCERIFREERRRTESTKLIEHHRLRVLEELDLLFELQVEQRISRADVSSALRVLIAKAKVLGLPPPELPLA